MFPLRKKKPYHRELSPDEIFLDSQNLPGFDQNQMEGRFEMLLSRKVALSLFSIVLLAVGVIFFQLWNLQIRQGDILRMRAFSNRMEEHALLPERGIIMDIRGKKLAWNEPRFRIVINASILFNNNIREELVRFFASGNSSLLEDIEKQGRTSSDIIVSDNLSWEGAQSFITEAPSIPFRVESSSVRRYSSMQGLSHIIGYIAYPDTDAHFLIADSKIGKTGIEQYADAALRGSKGVRLVELDAKGQIVSESIQKNAQDGASITLTIDAELQSRLAGIISDVSRERGFEGGAGVVLDIGSGAVRAVTSIPEFDANMFAEGLSQEEFSSLRDNAQAPFFFRALEGRYLPGSAFKPVLAFAALNERIITPDKEIFSSGSISIPHPYSKGQFSVFKDWKAHGWVDMRRALAVSSNVYFYSIGGGYEGQKGVGAKAIYEYARMFGFGRTVSSGLNEAAGHVPNPDEYAFWRVGDSYNFSIGQGELQVTPIQMARFIAMIANDGKVPAIHFIEDPEALNTKIAQTSLPDAALPLEYFRIVQEGLRRAVTEGTAQALSGAGVNVAGKTGTAEIGKGKVNSWFIGFFPYEHPRLALAIVLEKGDEKNLVGAASAAREFVQWLSEKRPEYVTKY